MYLNRLDFVMRWQNATVANYNMHYSKARSLTLYRKKSNVFDDNVEGYHTQVFPLMIDYNRL